MSHKSEVLIIGCSDPRLRLWLRMFEDNLLEELSISSDQIDRIIMPGAIPALAGSLSPAKQVAILEAIETLMVHQFGRIYLITHEDCAALGGSSVYPAPEHEKRSQKHLLSLAQKRISIYFHGLDWMISRHYVTKSDFEAFN